MDIGLDAGGSKTALMARTTRPAASISLVGPGANLQRLGLEETARVLAALVLRAARQQPQSSLRSVCAGVAGAGRPDDRAALAAQIRRALSTHAPAHIQVVHDGEIALEAAFEGGSGIIVIVGTGSIALARTRDGGLLRAGGWGYLLGDEGSGHALGVHGLRAVTAAFDGGPPTCLQDLLAERHGITTPDELIDRVYRKGWAVQQMAPLVVAAAAEEDAQARRIIEEQTGLLARHVEWLVRRCSAIEPRIALLGGLSQETYYRKALMEALLRRLPGWRFEKPLHPPVVGALRLAQQAK